MSDLKVRINDMCFSFEKELNREMNQLQAAMPKLDEIKMLRGEQHIDLEDHDLGHEDQIITRLREALHNEDICTPDEVINILTTAVFEKEKMKLQLQYM